MAFEIRKNPEEVLVCATGSGWELIPKKTDKTIYCLNDYVHTEKYGINPDILFIMDVLDEKPQVVSNIQNLGEVIARINNMKVPLIAPFKYEEIPLSEAFPLEECTKEFGMPHYSNTICYMIAYALLKGVKKIDLYGVNQAGSSEYTEEKSAVEYWLGIANGMKVKIAINGERSELLTSKLRYGRGILYGYSQTYEQILSTKEKFGDSIVKKLTGPPKQYARNLRKVSS